MNSSSKNSLCCIYAYFEKDSSYSNNLQYFVNNAILDNVDYYIVINGPKCSVNLPIRENVKVLSRENKGFDFGAYCFALKNLVKEYDYLFFLNTSVCGPYLRENQTRPWTEYFLELFTDNDVKVVGTSINICTINNNLLQSLYQKDSPYSHVQSMFFCIDNEYLQFLNKHEFFNEDEMNKESEIWNIILKKEIGLSQIAIKNGWNINSILSKYRGLDYRTINYNINGSAAQYSGDPYFRNTYFGETIDKYDAIFLKNNRF